jgi:hypothetical protein
MHQSGIFARQNDVFTTMFLGTLNGMLRSRLASCCLLVVMMFLATALIWNASVDQYVLREGRRVAVPVVDETWHSKSGYTTKYRYPGAGQGNPLHFFDSFFIQSGQSKDIGIANTFGTQSSCRPGHEMAMVAYLPNDPRVHVVVGDRTSFLFYAIGALCLAASGGLLWNLARLGRHEQSIVIPGWETTPGY